MGIDRKILYALSGLSFAALLSVLLLTGGSGRIAAAILLLPLTAIVCLFIKKRHILSINRHQVLLLMSVMGLMYVVLYYLSGLFFGFSKTGYKLNLYFTLRFILPITVITIATEVIRSVIRAQNSRLADTLCFATCVCAQMLIHSGVNGLHTYDQFMELVAVAFFPAILSNFLFHYTAKRFGPYPNIVFRLLTTLYVYFIPYKPNMPDSMFAFANLLIPLAIYFFLDALYEKKKRYALGKRSRLTPVFTALGVVVMAGVIVLFSNQFRFGALVIATDSMSGELDKGDIAIFERQEDHLPEVGQVITFAVDGRIIVHRLVDLERINGQLRFFTKGDANEEPDAGYITESQLVGTVKWKLPYIGYPTIWLRAIFP